MTTEFQHLTSLHARETIKRSLSFTRAQYLIKMFQEKKKVRVTLIYIFFPCRPENLVHDIAVEQPFIHTPNCTLLPLVLVWFGV